jgi:Homeodomain-like domain
MGRHAPGTMAGKAGPARRKAAAGWSVEALAELYGVPYLEMARALETTRYRRPRPSRALPSAELVKHRAAQARKREAAKARARARHWVGDDWRWKDDAGPDGLVSMPTVPEICAADLDQVVAPELHDQVEPPAPVAWEGPVNPQGGSVPRKVTAAVLAEAVELRAAGWSWPAIARRFGCHRMTLYQAIRRPALPR